MEINRWVMAFVFPILLLALPLCALADDMKDIREIRESLIRIEERMVTKDELKSEITSVRNDLKSEITSVRNDLKSEITLVRNDLKSETTAVRTEIASVRNELKSEIKDVRTELKEFMLWGFGVTFAGIFALIGFVLWDRRTALVPAIRKNSELEEREERVEQALKEIAVKDGNVREALRHVGILTD